MKSFDPTAKVLFLGNNDESTDHRVSQLAKQHATVNHGLVADSAYDPQQPGYYLLSCLLRTATLANIADVGRA